MMKTAIRFFLITAMTLSLSGLAEDKKPARDFNAALKEHMLKTLKMVLDGADISQVSEEVAKGAHALIKEFPGDVRPFQHLFQAGMGHEDAGNKEGGAKLKKEAIAGILGIFEKDKKNRDANKALLFIAEHVDPAQAKGYIKQVIENNEGEIADQAQGALWRIGKPIGKPLTIKKFTSIDGRKIDLAMMKGKVVLVEFWATWCGPCIEVLPDLKRAYSKYHGRGFEIIGISMDDNKNKLTRFVEKNEMPWPQYFEGGDYNQLATQLGAAATPEAWLIDKKGNLVDMNALYGLEAKIQKFLDK